MPHTANAIAETIPAVANDRSAWVAIRAEATALAGREPVLRHLLQSQVIDADNSAALVARVLASRLSVAGVETAALIDLLASTLTPRILACVEADLMAVRQRDPACTTYLHALLNLKGFHALQIHRIAHALWNAGRVEMASWLANLASLAFGPDIHPAARIGSGIMLDHGSGIVIGETAVIEDEVSILQNVTLGGTGKETGDRHPKIRRGVMIGAGAKILGNIEIGHCSKIAAGSVVLSPVPHNKTVAGVPARVVGETGCDQPSRQMDQLLPSQTMDQVVSFDI
jgi:serine O-acetyltransferase